jgi:hypothetical protein
MSEKLTEVVDDSISQALRGSNSLTRRVYCGHQLVLTPVSHEQHEPDQTSRKDEAVRDHLPTTCPVSAHRTSADA